MKIKKTKLVEVEEELSTPEIVEMLFDYDWWPDDWEETKNSFTEALEYDDPNITDKEIETILLEAKKIFDIKSEKILEEEKNQLSNRQNIIDWLSDIMPESYELAEGDVGYTLTVDQIVDLIIQNGNKN